MAYGFGNRTIRDGLVFYLDAVNPSSYISGSTIWKSIGKDSSIGSFFGDVAFSNNYNNRNAIIFDGGDDKIAGQMGSDNLLDIDKTGIITIQAFISINTNQSKRVIFTAGSNGDDVQYGIGISNTTFGMDLYVFNHTTNTIMPGIDIDIGRFPYRLITAEFGTTTRKVYYDEQIVGTHSLNHATIFGNNWYVGDRPLGGECLSGAIQSIRVYNRELSLQEISQIYQFYINR